MHVIVCIKQVPDSAQIRVHPVTNTIMRQGVPTIINPYDLFAIEEALRMKDQFGAKVTVLTMGPPMADQALRKALSYGCDNAILLSDRVFAGADTLATSYALATAIQKIGETEPFELIFCGKQTIDGDTAQVGPGIATRLGLQQLTYVSKIDSVNLEAKEIVVQRRAEGGTQTLKTSLPALITMLEDSNEIRFGAMEDAFRAARTELKMWSAKDAGVTDTSQCGLKGSPTWVSKVFAPEARSVKAKMITAADPNGVAEAAVAALFDAQPAMMDDLRLHASANA